MDMEHELRALRAQLAEKTRQYLRLQKEVCVSYKPPMVNSMIYSQYHVEDFR